MNPPPSIRQRIRIGEVMVLILGTALGLWLAQPLVRSSYPQGGMWSPFFAGIMFLSGISMVGPPLLLPEVLRRRKFAPRWGIGKTTWFLIGVASWLLSPRILLARWRDDPEPPVGPMLVSGFGLPIMALAALLTFSLAGRFRRALRGTWREKFGLGLGLVWAAAGLYVLWIISDDGFLG